MNDYCIFCLTQKTEVVCRALELSTPFQVISPQIVQRVWRGGRMYEEVRPYLPGYLFLYSDAPLTTLTTLTRIDGVIRVLGQLDDGYRLRGSDHRFSTALLNSDGVIGVQKVYQEGERLQLASGPLKGLEGQITRVDHRHGRLQMTFDFDGIQRRVWVGYNMIEKEE